MYELSIAAKYLIPKWRQLSVSIISLVSILVISAVVWLIVVFFSVTNGLTNSWVDKLIALTAPVRITPTPEYYHSYYYLVDGISGASDYTLKTVDEKRNAPLSDPYDVEFDEEIPISWKPADRLDDGSLRDPVKLAFAAISSLKGVSGLSASDYEMTAGNLRLRMLRHQSRPFSLSSEQSQNQLTQSSYIGSLDPQNLRLLNAITSPSMSDLSNLLASLSLRAENDSEEHAGIIQLDDKKSVQSRLKQFFKHVKIEELVVPANDWRLPKHLLPLHATWEVTAIKKNGLIQRILVAQGKPSFLQKRVMDKGFTFEKATLKIDENHLSLIFADGSESDLPSHTNIYLLEGSILPAKLVENSIFEARDGSSLRFLVNFKIQGAPISGEIPYGNLQIAKASFNSQFANQPETAPFWVYALQGSKHTPEQLYLPSIEGFGEGILLPKGFQGSGVLLGDTGYLSYFAPTISSVQEQRIPVFVAGFYDPGIIPIGGKYILTSKEITNLIRSFYDHEEVPFSNGINVRFENPEDAERVKEHLQKAFEQLEISPYWKIETYKEYEFTRDIIQQLQSEKRLYTLLATLIIIVACSNIISMLIILVNDKKLEIGILRSMGATSFSIAIIFGICGVFMGAIGSLLGTLAAFITLRNIQPIVDFIGRLQGYEMFNPLFYGDTLPSEISTEALTFVIFTTAGISLIAGIVPAIKASLLKPSAILKAE